MYFSLLPIRWLGPIVAATLLAVGLAVAGATPASASCDGPVQSFHDYATSAARIVIGDVIAVDPGAPWTDEHGRSSRFTLRVRYVLRGQAAAVLAMRDLAFLPCSDHIIIARKGDRIALALGVSAFSPRITFDTVAWIRGTPPDFAGIERITVADAFTLIGLTPGDTSTASPPTEPTAPLGEVAFLLASFAAWVVAWRWRFSTRS